MKRRELKKLALMGLSSGLMVASQVGARETNSSTPTSSTSESVKGEYDPNAGNMNYHLMGEDELLLELNDEGRALYNSLNAEGKALAIKVVSMMCDHTNECAGLNACKTEKNDCAGKGSCKGTGKCAFSDKNFAVKVVADKMAKKRAEASKPNSQK